MRISGTLKIPTYGCTVVFTVCDNIYKEFTRLQKKHKTDLVMEGEAEGIVMPIDISLIYLVLDHRHITHNTIAHESYHVIYRVMVDRGIQDDEAASWLAGHLAEFIYKFLDKKNLQVKHG